ncbi:MAG: hypothetical protein K1X86_15480 [Ignavibacteria bacterium]|nr:hypothetical protein [Ignavibacteria bacterium]
MTPVEEGLRAFGERVLDELENFIRRVLLKLQADTIKILRDNQKVGYTKQLISNIRFEIAREAMRITGVIGAGDNVRSGKEKFPYAIAVHEGTKPHFPPLEPIEKWVAYKGLAKRDKVNARMKAQGSGKISRASTEEQRVKQIAFLIARKISKKGTTALPFLKMALNQNLDWMAAQTANIKIN